MRSGFVVLVGASVLSLAIGGGDAIAKARHYHHRAAMLHSMQAPIGGPQYTNLNTGNNPVKRYPPRHMPDGAIKASTLYEGGNNPGKRYAVRHAPNDAVQEQTLLTYTNNPAKRYAVTNAGQ
jgi:hypothetical protein